MCTAGARAAGFGLLLSVAAGATLAQEPGTVVGWGGSTFCYPPPTKGFDKIFAGGVHSIGVTPDGSLVIWGPPGPGDMCDVPAPNAGFIQVAARDASGGGGHEAFWVVGHMIGLRSDGSVAVWGSNGIDSWYGDQHHHQDLGLFDIPEPNVDFTAVAAGLYHNLALKSSGTIVAWGSNDHGQCTVPEPNANFIAISAGNIHSLALRADGSVVAWGESDQPDPNGGLIGIAAGDYHNLAWRADGSIVAWGSNTYGECDVPAPNSGFVSAAAARDQSLALKADGSIVAWGYTGFGLCDVPPPNADFVAVAAGSNFNVALYRARPGDANRDGVVDQSDIDMFVLALTDPQACMEQYPGCDLRNADVNEDGVANAFDIEPFVALLIGG